MRGTAPEPRTSQRPSGIPLRLRWLLGLAPLALLAAVVGLFFWTDPLAELGEAVPPVEELTVEHVTLETNPRQVLVRVRNGGPDPVTVAQVLVDDAYWEHSVQPRRRIPRLDSATIRIGYPWVRGEAHEITLISETGVTFTHEIGVATETPRTTGATLWAFTLVGLFVGVLPVCIGLAWLPFVRRTASRWLTFFLALTVGLLVFLGVDALDEALETAERVPGALQGVGLVVLGVLGTVAALVAVDGWVRRRRGGVTPLFVAALIAVGIGLHNLGEGLAIGAAHAVGELGLTTFLIVGFMLHNVTEGLGIVTPLARTRVGIATLAGLGLLAGAPAIFGAYLGGLAYSPTLAVLFLSIGVGAIVQVVWEIGRLIRRESPEATLPLGAAGFVAGLGVMYGTGLLVAA